MEWLKRLMEEALQLVIVARSVAESLSGLTHSSLVRYRYRLTLSTDLFTVHRVTRSIA